VAGPGRFAPRTLIASSAVTVAVVVVGVLVSSTPAKQPDEPVQTTALPDRVHRASFCDRVPESDLEAGLGGPVTGKASYGPGQTETVADGVKDIVDEFSCSWVGPASLEGSGSIRTWLFAPPVTVAQATELAADVPKGCQAMAGAPAYGAPSSGYSCKDGSATLRGLFGDGWLTCQVQAPGDEFDLTTLSDVCDPIARAAAS
jgi:hypothetical protein